jgi:hypothetical protein
MPTDQDQAAAAALPFPGPDPAEAPAPARPVPWLRSDRRRLRGSLRLIGQAAREGWPVPDDHRAKLAAEVVALLDDAEALGLTHREVLALCKVLLAMERAGLRAETAAFRAERDALGAECAESIRRLRADDPGRWTYSALAERFGVSRFTVYQALLGIAPAAAGDGAA